MQEDNIISCHYPFRAKEYYFFLFFHGSIIEF